MDLTHILSQAGQPGEQGKSAELQLITLKQNNFPAFLFSLAQELADESKLESTRRLAGIVLKNQLESRDELKREQNAESWIALQTDIKEQIKTFLLKTIFSEVREVRRAGSQVITAIAAIEVPRKEWNNLIPFLLENADNPTVASGIKQSCLETLGYVCEELAGVENVFPQQQVNNILTAVVSGMRKEVGDNDLRFAATTALYNALDFARVNFDTEQERNYLMQVICEGTQCEEVKVRQASFECLVRIAQTYYDKLTAYMNEIYAITIKASKFDEEDVGLQAIEFWCTICEEELEIQMDQFEGSSDRVSHNFIKTARQTLVPLLLELLCRQEEGQESDDTVWNISMAAGTCLGLIANAVQDELVDQVMQFVEANIAKKQNPEDWRNREAATFAFGSILDGPSQIKLGPFVLAALPFLKNALEDENAQVRNTTAWTIGRVFEFLHGPETKLINQGNLEPLMSALLQAIKGEPHVAEKICYAISKLASGFPMYADNTIMSQYTQTLVSVLLETTDRQVQFGAKLQGSAYEALNEVIAYTSNDQLELVASLIDVILQRTGVVLQMQPQAREAQETQIQTLGKLCAVLQVIVQRLTVSEQYKVIVQERYADTLMQVLLQIQIRQDELGRSSVQEEAMLCIGALTYACESNFLRYMDSLYPVIERGLKNYQEIQVCEITVGLVGDICRGIGGEISRYCDGIMNHLIENLKNPAVHRNIKPDIMVVFGDIALAIGDQFEKYYQVVMLMLLSAMKLSMSSTQAMDEDFVDYNNELRKGICEACSGIIQGMSPEKNEQLIKPQASTLMEFLAASYEASDMDDDAQKAAVALLGDIASSCGNIGLFTQQWVSSLIQKCRQSQEKSQVDHANYAYMAVKKVINQPISAK